jgi:hypothetical protein
MWPYKWTYFASHATALLHPVKASILCCILFMIHEWSNVRECKSKKHLLSHSLFTVQCYIWQTSEYFKINSHAFKASHSYFLLECMHMKYNASIHLLTARRYILYTKTQIVVFEICTRTCLLDRIEYIGGGSIRIKGSKSSKLHININGKDIVAWEWT